MHLPGEVPRCSLEEREEWRCVRNEDDMDKAYKDARAQRPMDDFPGTFTTPPRPPVPVRCLP